MELGKMVIRAKRPVHANKDTVQLVLVLQNGDLRAVDIYNLNDPASEEKLKEAINFYNTSARGVTGPHGYFEDHKFFWTDTNGVKMEMSLDLITEEELEDGSNLPDQSE